jgi:hypothetical protein
MLLSLEEYRRHLRSTYDTMVRAGAHLESEDERLGGRDAISASYRYRRARDRERARRAANWFRP